MAPQCRCRQPRKAGTHPCMALCIFSSDMPVLFCCSSSRMRAEVASLLALMLASRAADRPLLGALADEGGVAAPS